VKSSIEKNYFLLERAPLRKAPFKKKKSFMIEKLKRIAGKLLIKQNKHD
jgi:hypothetical protein